MEGASFYWVYNEKHTWISDINLNYHGTGFIGVIGLTGSGKSNLLSALSGEMFRQKGIVEIKGKLITLSQESHIFEATFRENIILHQPFDNERYSSVIESCCLIPDLEMLPAGDSTYVTNSILES